MANATFKVGGLKPPDYGSRPDLHVEFWAAAVNLVLTVKDASLAQGLDAKGKKLKPLAQSTIEHRTSAMGPADPHAPPLTPAHGLSRTRSLLTAQAFPGQDYVLVSWKDDPVTGNPWGEILAIHRKGDAAKHLPKRNVIGMSPMDQAEVKAKLGTWWERRKRGPVAVPAFAPEVLPTPGPKFLIHNVPKYQPKNPANAIPKLKTRVSQIGINGHVYTLQGGSAAQIRRAIANGSFSGFGKAADFDPGSAPSLLPPPKPPKAPVPKKAKPKIAPKKEPYFSGHPTVHDRVPKPEGRPAPPERWEPPPPKAAETKPKKPRKPRAKPAEQTPPPSSATTFPADPLKLKVIGKLGGSTGAELVEDASGRKYVRKTGNSPDHIREEAHADAAYQALGARVPKFKLYDTPKGPVKLAEYIEGKTLAAVIKGDPKLARKAITDLQRHFAADALLGNWDVVGMGLDNVLVDAQGHAFRIDNGGALRFRAQGTRKTAEQWDEYPVELWTLRDPAKNPQTAKVFGDVGMKEIARQVRDLDATQLAGVLPDELAVMVGRRLGQLRDVARIATTLIDDRFKETYADGFTKHTIGIRKAGIAGRMPRRLSRQAGGVEVRDESGKPFDHLRGAGSLVSDLQKYVEKEGGTYATIRYWMSGQAGSSWSANSQALKRYLADRREAPLDAYFWNRSPADCAKELEKVRQLAGGPEQYETAIQALHAFTREYLERAEFEHKDAAAGTIRLMRTESRDVMQVHHMKKGDRKVMTRGAAESCSIYRKVSVRGGELTLQDVPLHRVLGTYWQERSPGQGGSAFLGDHENEFVCLLEGIEATYKK